MSDEDSGGAGRDEPDDGAEDGAAKKSVPDRALFDARVRLMVREDEERADGT